MPAAEYAPDTWLKRHPLLRYGLVIAILCTAFFLRLNEARAVDISPDSAAMSLKAIAVARDGQLVLQGPVMSAGLWHSPFTVYLYALPYRLALSPLLAMFMTGTVTTIGVATIYLLAARYFSISAGLFAAFFYAIHPEAVLAGLSLWNTNNGLPFVMLYLFLLLRGYHENSATARLAHLPLLSLAMQCHPLLAGLGVLAVPLWLSAWVNRRDQRRMLVWQTAVSGLIALLLLVPWLAGTWQGIANPTAQAAFAPSSSRGFAYLAENMYRTLANWYQTPLRHIHPALTLLGTAWLLWLALRRAQVAWPAVIVAGSYFLLPMLSVWADLRTWDYHYWPVLGSAFVLQGALVGGLSHSALSGAWRFRGLLPDRWLRWLAVALIVAATASHAYFYRTFDRTAGQPTVIERQAAIALTRQRAATEGRPIMLFVGPGEDLQGELMRRMLQYDDAWVIWPDRAMPLPADGAVVLAEAGTELPAVVASVEAPVFGYVQGEVAAVDAAPTEALLPLPVRFVNDITVMGARFTDLPDANTPWPIGLVWQRSAPPQRADKVFVQLVDAAGTTYAQQDRQALPAGQWRENDLIFSPFSLTPGDDLPDDGPLFLRFGFYDDDSSYARIGADGSPAESYALLQVRAASDTVAAWDGLSLKTIEINSPLVQGPPLTVRSTWQTTAEIDADVVLKYVLLNSDGRNVYDSSPPLSASAYAQWPPGTFASPEHTLRIPTDLPAGDYTLETGPEGATPHRLPVEILPRDRAYALPAVENEANARFGSAIVLRGYDLLLDGRTLSLNLYWQADAQLDEDLIYFVHVLQAGQLVAQRDSMPLDMQYPTSWWAPGEVVSNPVTLDLNALPPGDYQVMTGFYRPDDGARLSVVSPGTVQDNALELAVLVLE